MRRYARRFLSGYDQIESAVQDVFIKAYENINSYNHERPFSPWLYRLAHNEFIDILRKEKRSPVAFIDFDTILPHAAAPETADGDSLAQELVGELGELLEELNPKYREPIVLHYYEGFAYKDIADILKIPIGTVGIRIKRGRDRLRSLINSDQHV